MQLNLKCHMHIGQLAESLHLDNREDHAFLRSEFHHRWGSVYTSDETKAGNRLRSLGLVMGHQLFHRTSPQQLALRYSSRCH